MTDIDFKKQYTCNGKILQLMAHIPGTCWVYGKLESGHYAVWDSGGEGGHYLHDGSPAANLVAVPPLNSVSTPITYETLGKQIDQLNVLLKDKQPGLISWNTMFHEQLKSLKQTLNEIT